MQFRTLIEDVGDGFSIVILVPNYLYLITGVICNTISYLMIVLKKGIRCCKLFLRFFSVKYRECLECAENYLGSTLTSRRSLPLYHVSSLGTEISSFRCIIELIVPKVVLGIRVVCNYYVVG